MEDCTCKEKEHESINLFAKIVSLFLHLTTDSHDAIRIPGRRRSTDMNILPWRHVPGALRVQNCSKP